jgi:hypothetical protein
MASYQTSLTFAHRESKRGRISELFSNNIGKRFSSPWLHAEFGSSFRARVSEINLDVTSNIVIRNQNFYDRELDAEVSSYWAELRARHKDDN